MDGYEKQDEMDIVGANIEGCIAAKRSGASKYAIG